MKRIVLLVLFVLSAFVLGGCGAVGAGVGAAVPRNDVIEPNAIPRDAKIEMRDAHGKDLVVGHYVGVDGPDYLVQHGDELERVARNEVHDIRRRKGSYWVVGMVAGIACDVALVIGGVFAAQSLGAGLSAIGGM